MMQSERIPRRRGFVPVLLASAIILASCSRARTAGRWTPLFNGKDFTGWRIKVAGHALDENPGGIFRVEDGFSGALAMDVDDLREQRVLPFAGSGGWVRSVAVRGPATEYSLTRSGPEGDWLLAASESERGLILKSLGFEAGLETVFEDVA